jgi:hypothetical protein
MAEDVDVEDRTKEKGKVNPKKRQKGRKAVETKARARKVAVEKYYEFGHWAKDCPHMVNQVKQEPVAPNATASSSNQAAPARW